MYAADLNGDGYLDVMSASNDDDKIAWYENTGSGGFTKEQIVSKNVEGAKSVFSSDLDGDGDLDLLAASSTDDQIIST